MSPQLFSSPFSRELLSYFFESGMAEENSPLLSQKNRRLSQNLTLKSAYKIGRAHV